MVFLTVSYLSLKQELNFTARWHYSVDNNWGNRVPGANGSGAWNGVVGMLLRGEADMVMTSLSMTRERAEGRRKEEETLNKLLSNTYVVRF